LDDGRFNYPISLPAHFNKWNSSYDPPTFGIEYALYGKTIHPYSHASITLVDDYAKDFPFIHDPLDICGFNSTGRFMPVYDEKSIFAVDSCAYTNVNGQNLNITVMDAIAKMTAVEAAPGIELSDVAAVEEFSSIFLAITEDTTNCDRPVLGIAYLSMKQAYLDGIASGEISASSSDNAYTQVINAIDHLIALSDTDYLGGLRQIHFEFDKVMINRLVKEHATALSILQGMTNAIQANYPEHEDYLNQWKCIIETETEFINEEIDYRQLVSLLDQCYPSTSGLMGGGSSQVSFKRSLNETNENQNNKETSPPSDKEMKEKLPVLLIKPHPVTAISEISINAPGETGLQLIITDLTGKILLTIPVEMEHHKLTISNTLLKSGMYIIQLKAGNRLIEKQKMIVVH
jgi:hypothetical protein